MKNLLLDFLGIRKVVQVLEKEQINRRMSELEKDFIENGASKKFCDWIKEYYYPIDEIREYLTLIERKK